MSDQSRRKLLKSIAAGGGAIVAGKSLPEQWVRPVVDSVILPAHAQTSCTPTVVQIPSNTEVNANNFNADDSNFWFCTPGTYTKDGGSRNVLFLESGVTLNVDSSNTDTYYVKSGAVLNINAQINNIVYLEPGAVYNENGGTATVINVCGIEFDTSLAPSCP